MSLAPGTALQNGHYVVDALLEAAPNGDLYWGTHVVAGMPVFIQAFPVTAEPSDLSNLMARLEGIAFSPRSPLPSPLQLFHGDDHVLCLAMSTTVGLPWSSVCGQSPRLAPKQALKAVRDIADKVTWLHSQGLSGMDLSPNRVWISQDFSQVTLTGLPYKHLQTPSPATNSSTTTIRHLAQLLFSFLTGQWPLPADGDTPQTVKARLRKTLPHLSPVIGEAIAQGLFPGHAAGLTLSQWLDQLPDARSLHPVPTPSSVLTRQVSRPKPTAVRPSQPGNKLGLALVGTGVFAAIAGVALGTVWRLNAASLPGAIQLDPNQSFPTRSGWSADTPEVTFDTPYVPASNRRPQPERWYEESSDPTINESLIDTNRNAIDDAAASELPPVDDEVELDVIDEVWPEPDTAPPVAPLSEEAPDVAPANTDNNQPDSQPGATDSNRIQPQDAIEPGDAVPVEIDSLNFSNLESGGAPAAGSESNAEPKSKGLSPDNTASKS